MLRRHASKSEGGAPPGGGGDGFDDVPLPRSAPPSGGGGNFNAPPARRRRGGGRSSQRESVDDDPWLRILSVMLVVLVFVAVAPLFAPSPPVEHEEGVIKRLVLPPARSSRSSEVRRNAPPPPPGAATDGTDEGDEGAAGADEVPRNVPNRIDDVAVGAAAAAAEPERREKAAPSSPRRSLPEPPPAVVDSDHYRYRVVFSTDCRPLMHWQSYLLFHSAMSVDQPGNVTRIASGCDDDQIAYEKRWHETHIRDVMSERFKIHFTPKFSDAVLPKEDGTTKKGGKDYKYFNKPFGLLHWLERGEDMGLDPATGKLIDEDAVIVLLDPDMVLLRPITSNFADHFDEGGTAAEEKVTRVSRGVPFGQRYGLGSAWISRIRDAFPSGDTPASSVSRKDAEAHYPAGPPYVATAVDMHTIAKTWSDIVPRVHRGYPYLLAEMYAYCVAAAHNGLPHVIVESMMVSNTGASGEGWPYVDDDEIPAEKVCETASSYSYPPPPRNDDRNGRSPPKRPIPNAVHYCQRYLLGKYFFAKHRVPHDIFSCDKPLIKVPPPDLAALYDYAVPPPPKKGKADEPRENYGRRRSKREAFMICHLIRAVNEAGEFYRRRHCMGDGDDEGQRTKYNETALFGKTMMLRDYFGG